MKKIIFPGIILTVTVFLIISSCDKIGNSNKGNCKDDAEIIHMPYETPWNDSHFNMQIDGNYRVFQVYTNSFENVCPDEHIKIEVACIIMPPGTRNIQLRIEYRYGLFGAFGNTWTVPKNYLADQIVFEGNTTFGIKNAYDNEPGSFYLNIEWVLDNYLDESVDLEYFKTHFNSIIVSVSLKRYKN
jgi:hypothetical protein